MIQIQIATRLTEHGVADIRWVLLESDEAEAPSEAQAAPPDEVSPGSGPPTESPADTGGAVIDRTEARQATAAPPRSARRWPGVLAWLLVVAAAGWLAANLWERGPTVAQVKTSVAAEK